MFRTSIQCAAWCTDYDTCVAFRWQENADNFLCTLISKEGLCLDMDRVNPTKVFVDQNNIPSRGKFRHFYSVKGFKKTSIKCRPFLCFLVFYRMLRIFGTRKELLRFGKVSY